LVNSAIAAAAEKPCPGVSEDIGPTGMECGANTGAITANNLSSSQQRAKEKRRKQIQEREERERRGFAPDETEDSGSRDSTFESAFGGLGYAKSPMYTKANPPEPSLATAVWARGGYAYQDQTGISNLTNFAALSRTAGALAGIDWTWMLPSDHLFTFGAFGGDGITTHTMSLGDKSTTRTPTAGGYILYIAGESFSADLSYAHSWFQNSGPNKAMTFLGGFGGNPRIPYVETAQETATAGDLIDGNVHYRFNPNAQNGSWWWEPTVGVTQIFITQSMGNQNQTITRVTGGVNVGTTFNWGAVEVEPTLSAFAFSDVSIKGVDPDILTDRGQLWGKGIAALNFVLSRNFSTAIEGQVYGTSGALNIIGYAGVLKVRHNW
jgi:hypothetical protein